MKYAPAYKYVIWVRPTLWLRCRVFIPVVNVNRAQDTELHASGFYVTFNASLKFNKGRWLSGRRRQTVNLLVIPRWFESNSSHISTQKLTSQLRAELSLFKPYRHKNFFLRTNSILFKDFSEHLLFFDKRESFLKVADNNDFLNHICSFFNKFIKHQALHTFHVFNFIFTSYRFVLFSKPLTLSNFFSASKLFLNDDSEEKLLTFNFKRSRFFPDLQTKSSDIYFNLSLGLFAFFYKKGKFFIKNKQVFLVLASFLRKILLFCSIGNLIFVIKRTPIYLQELLTTLNNPVVNPYKHPFHDSIVWESSLKNRFNFKLFLFLTNRPYGFIKVRKKGRVKRKITKRIVSINRLVD
jgi:hypothetical protein